MVGEKTAEAVMGVVCTGGAALAVTSIVLALSGVVVLSSFHVLLYVAEWAIP